MAKSVLRSLKTVSSTLQDLQFDGSADDFLHAGEIEVKIKEKLLFFIGNLFFSDYDCSPYVTLF